MKHNKKFFDYSRNAKNELCVFALINGSPVNITIDSHTEKVSSKNGVSFIDLYINDLINKARFS